MSQRPVPSHGGSQSTTLPLSPEPPATLASFDTLLSAGDRDAPVTDPAGALVDGRVPATVLRQWSDALAAAGMFTEALTAHPGLERADMVRRAELAVLAGDHLAALSLLAELRDGLTARTVPANPGGRGRPVEGEQPSPWLELLTGCARVLGGERQILAEVMVAARRVHPSAAVSWVVALAALAAGDLAQAGPAAITARAGGCRDQRILAISAAERAVAGDDWAAIELIRGAQRVALPDEDPAGLVVDLLDRAGSVEAARRLAARASTDVSLPPPARAAWSAAAHRIGVGRKQIWRRSMTAAGSMATRRREQAEQRQLEASLSGLTCRCYGSTGWIGQNRGRYVSRHLQQVLPAPVAGLPARLMRCRATKLTFLDFEQRQLTLPVVSEVSADLRSLGTDPFADPDADPEARPTPGMGVSLGLILPA